MVRWRMSAVSVRGFDRRHSLTDGVLLQPRMKSVRQTARTAVQAVHKDDIVVATPVDDIANVTATVGHSATSSSNVDCPLPSPPYAFTLWIYEVISIKARSRSLWALV